MPKRTRKPQAPTLDVEAYAAELVDAAPPLNDDQLDALGQILRAVPPAVIAEGVLAPKKPRRRRHRQLELPLDLHASADAARVLPCDPSARQLGQLGR